MARCLWQGQEGTARFSPPVRACREGPQDLQDPLDIRPALTKPCLGLGLGPNSAFHLSPHQEPPP